MATSLLACPTLKNGFWQTCSAQGDVSDDFSLVLNEDNMLSILNPEWGEIWSSATDETCCVDCSMLVLLSSAPDGHDKLECKDPLKVPDPLTNSDICLVQPQGEISGISTPPIIQ
jgi:hypothetical protein